MSTDSPNAALAFVFPGQGAQAVGMMDALAAEFPHPRQRFAAASAVLGFDLWDLVVNGPAETLNSTVNTQPALLAASVACWDIWRELGGPRPALMAGHSFGEYSALVCAGALDFAAGIALVAARGRFMQEAVAAGAGGMAAVMGLDTDAVTQVCAEAEAAGEVCAPANLNAPGQIVISGSKAGVDRGCELAVAAGAKRTIPLSVSAPAHCELMRPAAARLEAMLADTAFDPPQVQVLHNVDVARHADAAGIRSALVAQMYSPVRWIETVETFVAAGVTELVECGPGKVLSGLARRINRNLNARPFGDRAALSTTISELGS